MASYQALPTMPESAMLTLALTALAQAVSAGWSVALIRHYGPSARLVEVGRWAALPRKRPGMPRRVLSGERLPAGRPGGTAVTPAPLGMLKVPGKAAAATLGRVP
jgi:hypothetical protein